MKKSIYLYLLSFVVIINMLLFNFCSPGQETIETTTIYLQDIEVTGPINLSPIHISDSCETPSITFSPRFSYSTTTNVTGKISGHTLVNENGIFQIDTVFNPNGTINYYEETPGVNRHQYTENNLLWHIPSVTLGLDVDIKITQSFALFGGVNYSSNNNKSLLGGNFGLGLYGSSKKGLAFRLDVGAHIQSIAYNAYTVETVEITGPSANEEYVIFYHDIDESSHFNPFINLTINSFNPEWILNFFINFGYSAQTLADFEPRDTDDDYYDDYYFFYDSYREFVYDMRGESTIGLLHVTPGLTFNFSENYRLLIGSRFYFLSDFDSASTKTFILPMLQVDFTL